MKNQIIISVSREFGSAGHEIAEKIATDMGLKFYDRKMLDEIASSLDVKVDVLEKYDEKPKNVLLSRRVGKYSNSMEEILSEIQFDFIKDKAESGESFVIVGRCSDLILQGRNDLVKIFISGNEPAKVYRVMNKYHLDQKDALAKMRRHDKTRKNYHNRHGDSKWGDSRHYDLCINSCLGVDKTAEVIEHFVKSFKEA